MGTKTSIRNFAKIVLYFKFINKQPYRQRSWMKWDAACPYWSKHQASAKKLKFVSRSLFNFYCDAPRKLRKLYWRLHKDNQ